MSKDPIGIIILCVFIVWIVWCLLTCTGCSLVWTDQAFIATLFKEIDANGAGIIVDPNTTIIGSGQIKTQNNPIKATALVGGVPFKVETESKGK